MVVFRGTILVLLLALSSTQSRPETHEKTTLSKSKATNSKKATSGSHLVEPKGSATQKFETAHKLPSSLAHLISLEEEEETVKKHSVRRRDAPAPAPAGSIRLDPKKLIEKYKHELKTSTTTAKTHASRKTSKRTKKEAHQEDAPVQEPTSPRPSLTSGAPITARSLDIHNSHLVGSGSEKQRSRIQIKKGPNGQEYEYEYVYYYYDDDEDKDKSGVPISNSHDGPQPNQIPTDSKKTDKAIFNEVLPASRERTRGRQLEDEDVVGEERLPANTRFPPRSRNLATTPLPEEDAGKARARTRGRSTTQSPSSEPDSNSDESQSKSRTRANVRRPSLDLVDSASFNTHQGAAGAEPPVGGPSFPSDLPAGPVRFLGATPNERIDLQESSPQAPESPVPSPSPVLAAGEEKKGATPAAPIGEEVSSATTGMDKVALDLYAISQGTQKLPSGEPTDDASQEPESTPELTTDPATTEPEVSSSNTTSTTTTTTTTTTQAPSTTTTTESPAGFGRGRFRGRGAVKKSPIAASTTTEAAAEGKSKNRFGRPSFGSRPRHGGAAVRTTAEPSHESSESHKEEGKPIGRSRPTLSRRFGTTRSKPSSTEASNEQEEQSHSSTPRSTLTRPRPSFNLRSRGRSTTTAPDSEGSPQDSSPSEDGASSTTARSRARLPASPGVRPLRPGPRINLARGRPGSSTAAPSEGAQEEATSESSPDADDAKEAESSPPPAEDKSPLSRLRNRPRLNPSAQPRAKAAASSPVQVRRINPLLNRRRPGAPEASSSEAPPESPATEGTDAPEEEEEASNSESSAPSSSTTTEEPKGLNKLLAGRRRLIARQPGTLN